MLCQAESEEEPELSSSDVEEFDAKFDARCTSCAKAVSRCHPHNGLDDDYQYKRHGGRCFKCRGPAPGEGHFMPAEPVTPLLRPYTLADYKEVTDEDWSDGEATPEEFVRVMSIRGVENYIESQGDIQLDLRWFRLPDCLCATWPCPCMCEAAYAAKISKFLGIAHTTYHRGLWSVLVGRLSVRPRRA